MASTVSDGLGRSEGWSLSLTVCMGLVIWPGVVLGTHPVGGRPGGGIRQRNVAAVLWLQGPLQVP